MNEYSRPTVEDLGSVAEQTLITIDKKGVKGDFLVVNGQAPVPIDGSQLDD